MKSFNAFGSKSTSFGGNTPIWLGVVSPRVTGAALLAKFVKAGRLYPAGSPVEVKNDANGQPVAGILVAWQVVSVDSTDHIITIKANRYGIAPVADDILSPIGATFATTGAAGKVSSIVAGSTAGTYDVTMSDGKLDGVSANSYITYSAATAVAASGASIAVQPNGYLYNDIRFEAELGENPGATAAIVDFHGEGLFIDRTPSADFAAMLKAAVPNVIQIKG